ncbi:winged helix-turn-helix transcriptional regulator [Streptomyces albus]|uniref:winged helix-turn-helix transcriptional regulator n=1 Tax=Streptomyces albus TaxID=1888 RepID=UPI002446639E|nr:winged helix-turn-helix transcriptional regulator [Streptomyces albus]
MSPKVPTHALSTLQRDSILSRSVTMSVPVRVDRALTPLGEYLALLPAVVRDRAETHHHAVHAVRERCDTENVGPLEKWPGSRRRRPLARRRRLTPPATGPAPPAAPSPAVRCAPGGRRRRVRRT